MIKYSIFNLKRIYFLLGTACNFNCVYCVQHENKPRCKKQVNPEVLEWLEDIAYQLPKKSKPSLIFFGGEPLLYKETIHTIVDTLKDSFDYTILSNGSYLTEEDVEYFNENDITFSLSHDGPNTDKTRHIDMLLDPDFIKTFSKLKKKNCNVVFSAVSQDIQEVYNYIQDKVDASITVEDLICNSYTKDFLVDFNQKTLLNTYYYLGTELEKFWENSNFSNGAKLFNTWLTIANKRLNTPEFLSHAACGTGFSNLSVDTQGKIYLCKNFNLPIGTIKDSYETLVKNGEIEVKKLLDKNLEAKNCFTCPAFYFCRGGCPFEESSETQKKKCEMLKTKWASVVSFIDNKLEIYKK